MQDVSSDPPIPGNFLAAPLIPKKHVTQSKLKPELLEIGGSEVWLLHYKKVLHKCPLS